ncbi:trans-1,2-dihydrobenzene-1,2-diol dehydrogenase [Latimeria chalumnae]|uniref:Trans-1,2-dihydrobenzene-1,2-diol dehydrogenase n=1 Tax=Latimeria chalumnae TaxID=7897 RepID=H3AUI9_LATCH|nr:PREDICTED: trans-1,2-dihydrobenzene-1,2-diol dehydrogenase [Latimeria chalumnae]|eukprot:XP_005996775.1 PREDICTED: trans-1,2-dihydrobenzene-1,2-diol dehydrogenase [Latimeria chalumnae]
MAPTRWGICTIGKISHDFTVALRTLPAEEHQVVAVAARDLARAQEFAKRHSIPVVHSSYEELAKDANIDVVYLGTIHPYHLSLGLLFLNSRKNVLCEKPLAMNQRGVQQLLSAARENGVFLMEGFWTRFFPASEQIRSLLSQNAVGEVKLVRAEFGVNLTGVPRAVEKKLGGGSLLDIGCYCLQFISMVFSGQKPESITATGFLNDEGVDETVTVVLTYPGKRLGILTSTIMVNLENRATITGTKGTIEVPAHMWCPTSLRVNGEETQYLLPPPSQPLNFLNSTGLRYEAEEVRQCLLKGLKESPQMTLAESELFASIMDEVRRQMGVAYPQDSP